jgi:hypothetical protein
VSTELDRKVEALTTSIHALATELREKEVPQDRITSIEAEIEVKSSQIDDLLAEKRNKEVDTKLAELDERLKSFNQAQARTKAAAILAGVSDQTRAAAIKAVGQYTETSFLKALVNRRSGDQDAQEFVKSVLGTSDATGQAVVPNNFVAGLVDQLALNNPYRELFDVVTGVRGAAVDIPYSITGITAALLQGAYGSNKDVRDFSFNQATATLYTIAQIADVGNQLLRQSEGAAEKSVRNRLGKSIGMLEADLHHERLGQLPAARLLHRAGPVRRPGRLQDDALLGAASGCPRPRHRGDGESWRQPGQPRLRLQPDRLLGNGLRGPRHGVCRWLGRRSGRRRGRQPADHLGVGRSPAGRPELADGQGGHRAAHRPQRCPDLHGSGVPDRCLVRGGHPLRPEHHRLPR